MSRSHWIEIIYSVLSIGQHKNLNVDFKIGNNENIVSVVSVTNYAYVLNVTVSCLKRKELKLLKNGV